MNRARQAEITQEILEVVAGADALTALDAAQPLELSTRRRSSIVPAALNGCPYTWPR